MWRRYLLNLSYLGTPFRGAQKQTKCRTEDVSTVQGHLEIGLKILNPSNEPAVALSSRTDAGVHALNTTAHVDLYRDNGFQYEPKTVTFCLNKYFYKNEIPIRIINSYLIPDDFHCRHTALSRTYLYRFAIVKNKAPNEVLGWTFLPMEAQERCYFVSGSDFDINRMRSAAKLFVGLHDFRTFMGKGSHALDKPTVRYVNRIDILEGQSLLVSPLSWPTEAANSLEDCVFYDVYVESKSFVYRQVRRMVSALLAVSQGKISESEVRLMLEVPSHRSWLEKIQTVPSFGLYLCQVKYSESDRARFRASIGE